MSSVLIEGHAKFGFGEVAVPAPAKGQVLVKVEAATLNPSDILFMRGLYNIKLNYPYTPGWEGAGTVVKLGEGVSQDLLGKKVAFMKSFEFGTYKDGGSYAEYCVTNASQVFPVSGDLHFDDLASFVVNPMTAVCMIERVKQLKSKCVIITAAASQIGRMLIKLCHINKITPICTVRRAEQLKILTDLGVKHAVDTSSPGYKKQMTEICLQLKPTSCLECISGDTTGEMLEYLGFKSTLILYGLLSEQPAGGIKTIPFIGKA